ncbi:MAG: glycerate kinase [bacterium]
MGKIVIAPDKYKGCLSSPAVCAAIREGLQKSLTDDWRIKICPQADGGEGTVEAIVAAMDGELKKSKVKGPRGKKIEAGWGWIPAANNPGANHPAAVIEMAAASGLALLKPEQQNPLLTTSYGTGQLIREAAQAGAGEILLGIGGSATVDGGLGIALALGFEVFDRLGDPVGEGGAALANVSEIRAENIPDCVKKLDIKVACDVTNPLLGSEGAARVYGPQKGADRDMVETLEKAMENWADVIESYSGSRLRNTPGTGAAGGIGFCLMGLLDAELTSGAKLVVELTKLSHHLKNADVLITGEGALDDQTAYGKTPAVVADLGKKQQVELIIGIAGALLDGYRELYDRFDILLALPRRPLTLEESIEQAHQLLEDWGADIGRLLKKFCG